MYAVIKTGGKQYRVENDQKILVERINDDEGTIVTLPDLLMVVDSGKISKGSELQNLAVSATVIRQTRGPKIITLKHRRRKNSRRVKGHRQDLTLLKVVGIGDPKKLSDLLNLDVVSSFRENDVNNGGQGAPLTPIFHYYLTKSIKKKICFINLGGISNITYFNHRNKDDFNKIIAFDAGPCCSLIDDWIFKNTNKKFDKFGLLARKGNLNKEIINNFLRNLYFKKKPPKSLDRSFFNLSSLKRINVKDGAATLNYFIVQTLLKSFSFLPSYPDLCILSGGGRFNKFLVDLLNKEMKAKVILSDYYKWDGDAIEAHAFAYLAVRKLLNLHITFPKTTGVKKPLSGGRIGRLF